MNPIEAIALKLLKNLVAKDPTIASGLLAKVLTKKGVDPEIVSVVSEAVTELVPLLLAEI